MDDVQTLAEGGRVPFEEAIAAWAAGHPERHRAATLGMDDMLRGGICNVSRHTQLPPALLADLAYERGEDTEFFAEGPYCGTPFRTLPARKKPLIKIDNDYYGVDTCLTRDASYRALLWNLLRRKNVSIEFSFEYLIAIAAQHHPRGLSLEFHIRGIRPKRAVFGTRGGRHGVHHGGRLEPGN